MQFPSGYRCRAPEEYNILDINGLATQQKGPLWHLNCNRTVGASGCGTEVLRFSGVCGVSAYRLF